MNLRRSLFAVFAFLVSCVVAVAGGYDPTGTSGTTTGAIGGAFTSSIYDPGIDVLVFGGPSGGQNLSGVLVNSNICIIVGGVNCDSGGSMSNSVLVGAHICEHCTDPGVVVASIVGIGESALYNTKMAGNPVAVGQLAGHNLYVGVNDAFLGFEAGYGGSLTGSANYSTGLGAQTLWSFTNIFEDTAAGALSQYSVTTGSYNSSLGVASLYSCTTCDHNDAQGDHALYAMVSGSGNNADGYGALGASVADNYNNAQGFLAAASVNGAGGVVALGAQALQTDVTGANDTAIGFYSAHNALGANIVAIGANTAPTLTSGGNDIYLGASVDASSATVSNEMNLGGVIVYEAINATASATGNLYGTIKLGGSNTPTATGASVVGDNNGGSITVTGATGAIALTFASPGFPREARCTVAPANAGASSSNWYAPLASTTGFGVYGTLPSGAVFTYLCH